MSNRTVMGFDFGTKSIGVAIGQEITGTARPLASFKAKDGIPDWSQIEKIIKEWQPDLVIVGLPLNMDGTEQLVTTQAKNLLIAYMVDLGCKLLCMMNDLVPLKLALTFLNVVVTVLWIKAVWMQHLPLLFLKVGLNSNANKCQ